MALSFVLLLIAMTVITLLKPLLDKPVRLPVQAEFDMRPTPLVKP